MKSAAAMLLWILIVLLPLNGYASATASVCASHRVAAAEQTMRAHPAAMPAMAEHTMTHELHADHASGDGPGTAPHCHCATLCVAQCGAAIFPAMPHGGENLAVRSESLPWLRPATPRPSASFDLLRPPKHTTAV